MKIPISNTASKMYKWVEDLFPINRSLTGPGVRETLQYLQKIVPELTIQEVPTGTNVFDWTVPEEWSVHEAYIQDEDGEKIVDFDDHNLHLVGYSEPVDEWMTLEDLENHLYTLPDQPDAIPYVTSYYKRRWGFCMTQNQKDSLRSGKYHVYIDSQLKSGVLNYGEIILPGQTEKEILLSTYICHPSMANNELSGPAVTTALAKWLTKLENRKYTYRIVYVPETIGAITYISKHIDQLKKNVIAGYQITCVGDERNYSFLSSRYGNTLADRVAKHVLKHAVDNYKEYSFLERGSDERQYCSPGIDLPVASIMRSKYGEYSEYHTSLDNLDLVTQKGLEGAYEVYKKVIEAIENNCTPKVNVYCEPQLGKRGLYPDVSKKDSATEVRLLTNFIAYADGKNDLFEIAEILDVPIWNLYNILFNLIGEGLMQCNN